MVTEEQKSKIAGIEQWLGVEFTGKTFEEAEDFIETYYEDAEWAYNEAASEYYSNFMW